MRYLLFSLFFLLPGCVGTADYYASKTAYYNAQSAAQVAYIQAANRPIAEMTAPDGTRFVVNNTAIQAPRIHQANSPIVDGMKVVLNSTPVAILFGGWAAKEIIQHSAGTLINNGDGSISSNSGNTSTFTNGDTDNSTSTTDDHTTHDINVGM